MLYPALFLDRDGVIIENRANYVRSWADVEIFPQAIVALARIRRSPYKIFLVTNQSAVGRGIITLETAQAINDRLVKMIEGKNGRVDAVYMCPHAPGDNCSCRKPKPGLLLQAAANHAIDLSRSIMIGDALTDLAAGKAAGVAQTILLRTGRGNVQAQLPQAAQYAPFPIYDTLTDALADLISVIRDP
ncbi:MAG: HAD family hydrolase [Chloroflexi bacterium]|nr:HAD family hydrolase [Chloroflexota bacterium]